MLMEKQSITKGSQKTFKIRSGSSCQTKRMDNPTQQIIDTFYDTTVINISLKQKRQPVAKGVIIMKNVTKELKKRNMDKLKDGYETDIQKLNKLKEEIKALPAVLKPIPNPRAYNMILNQKRERRMAHIREMQDFDNVIKGVKSNSVEKMNEVKNEVEGFEKGTKNMIDAYFKSLEPQILAEREIDIVDELQNFASDIETRMTEKLKNINEKLDDCEDFFYDSIQQEVEDLKDTLVEIGFELEPEIKVKIEEIRQSFKEDIEKGKSKNKKYYEDLKERVTSKITETKEITQLKEAEWRKIKHGLVLEEFAREINSEKTRHPQERQRQFGLLDDFMQKVYNMRMEKVEYLEGLPAGDLTKTRFENYLAQIREINESAQKEYDKYVERQIALKKDHMDRINTFVDYIKSRIEHYDAELPEGMTREQLYDEQIDRVIKEINENQEQIIKQAIDFMEERDQIQNFVCLNIGHNFKKFGERMDKYIIDHTTTENKYEYEKVLLEDESEDKLAEMGKELDSLKKRLRESVDHLKLDQNLELCFRQVDKIEEEFREYHRQNLDVVKKHAPFIEEMFNNLENDFANLMELRETSKLEELKERARLITRWKAKMKTDNFVKDEAEKEEKELAKLMEENKDNKKFKAPKPKVKNEKQLKQEWDELFENFCKELEVKVIQIDDIGTGNPRLIDRSSEAFVRSLYHPCKEEEADELTDEEKEAQKKIEKEQLAELQAQKLKEQEEEKNKKGAGVAAKKGKEPSEPEFQQIADPEDIQGYKITTEFPKYENQQNIFTKEYIIEEQRMLKVVKDFQQKIFAFLAKKKKECLENAEQSDNEFLETSLALLDERLKNYYPLKGKIQTEIYLLRTGEITSHKSNYGIFVKKCLDLIDEQTDRFNFYYQEIFDEKKSHSQNIDNLIKILPQQLEIANLQGVQSKAKEADLRFGELLRATFQSMLNLSSSELDNVTNQIERLIEQYKLNEEYSEDEVAWYNSMLEEIRQKVEHHKIKRSEIYEGIKTLSETRKKEAINKFDHAFDTALDELSARDAKGKVFGQPKRDAQNIVRNEYTLAQNVENMLKDKLQEIKDLVKEGFVGSLTLRFKLMSLRECCFFYGNYLNAFKEDHPLLNHPRISYKEKRFGLAMDEDEKIDDNERIKDELKDLQRMYYRGSDVRYTAKVEEMDKALRESTLKIYIGEYSKLLGADKLTDVLRTFLRNLRMEMEEFRINAVRQLRIITDEFIEISPGVSRLLFDSLNNKTLGKLTQDTTLLERLYKEQLDASIAMREEHIVKLCPKLSHPENAEVLDELNKKEAERHSKALYESDNQAKKMYDLWFEDSNEYFVKIINNFQFLLVFYDNWIQHEDFISLPGDENIVEKHLSLKKLMIRQKKGELTDTSSMRAIKKTWKTYDLNTFQVLDRIFEFQQTGDLEENLGDQKGKKDKKGGNKNVKAPPPKSKPAKGGKNGKSEEGIQEDVGKTKKLASYKTSMHKSAFSQLNTKFITFKNLFDAKIQEIGIECEKQKESEYHFLFFWETTNRRLFNDSIQQLSQNKTNQLYLPFNYLTFFFRGLSFSVNLRTFISIDLQSNVLCTTSPFLLIYQTTAPSTSCIRSWSLTIDSYIISGRIGVSFGFILWLLQNSFTERNISSVI